ncbi:hypothetical protein PAECIP111893_05130 [Paenibacillus plantiphilus]|uniref:Uncharacterized protein n=1 Tax=Paenibacillus plantiphilus TaxID=2905650 RepID=A0ABN8H1C6_9BACL|nr:hypothetical protein PAECIP111893_05130 [Paenibacillus plantiphilus]
MIDLFSMWMTPYFPQIYQQPVDNNVNNLIPLLIIISLKSCTLWMKERITPNIRHLYAWFRHSGELDKE